MGISSRAKHDLGGNCIRSNKASDICSFETTRELSSLLGTKSYFWRHCTLFVWVAARAPAACMADGLATNTTSWCHAYPAFFSLSSGSSAKYYVNRLLMASRASRLSKFGGLPLRSDPPSACGRLFWQLVQPRPASDTGLSKMLLYC